MPQEQLNVAQISTCFEKMRGKAVAQVMTGGIFLYAAFFQGLFKDCLDRADI